MTISPKSFKYEERDGVARIVLARPAKKNALTFEVYRELVRFFEDARRDPKLKVVVLTGTGKGFCTGADLSGPRRPPASRGPTGRGSAVASCPS